MACGLDVPIALLFKESPRTLCDGDCKHLTRRRKAVLATTKHKLCEAVPYRLASHVLRRRRWGQLLTTFEYALG
jgi:hypothetical protein